MKTLKKTLFIAGLTMGTFFLTSCDNEGIKASPEEVQIDDTQNAAVRNVTIFYNGKSFKTTEGGGQDIDLSVLDEATSKIYDEAFAIHLPDEIHLFDTVEEYSSYVQGNFPELPDANDDSFSRMAWRWFYGIETDALSANKWGNTVYLNGNSPLGNREQAVFKDANYRAMIRVFNGEPADSLNIPSRVRVRYIGNDFNNRTTYVTLKPSRYGTTYKRLQVWDGKFGGATKSIFANPRQGIWNRRISLSGGVSSFELYQYVRR